MNSRGRVVIAPCLFLLFVGVGPNQEKSLLTELTNFYEQTRGEAYEGLGFIRFSFLKALINLNPSLFGEVSGVVGIKIGRSLT